MEAAAKKVELLSQRILPELPHQLSYSAHWRYRPPPDDDPRSNRFEEWHNTRLQYLTFVSEADRGVLLTRSYHDMREEAPKPVPKEVSALAKSGVEKKKLSLSDYKNKKTTGGTSASPPEPAIAKRKESERASAAAAPTPPPTAAEDSSAARKSSAEMRKADRPRPRESDSATDGKSRQSRDNAVDMSLPPKPPPKNSLPPRPPSPSSKKRPADLDEESRPQKRSKPESGRSSDTGPSNPRDDAIRRKDRPSSAARDTPPPSSLPNGRPLLKGTAALNRNGSPLSRPRSDSVNGARPNAAASKKTTPTKPDAPPKTSVPPLLSPLKLNFEGKSRKQTEESDYRQDRKRREDGDGARSPRAKNREAPSGTRRDTSPLALPPLLSPTLPPAVEAALSRPSKASPDSIDEGDSGSAKRKAPVESPGEQPIRKPNKKRMVVSIRIPKRLRQTVRRILALPPGQTTRREPQDRERQPSDEPSQPSQAKKRPAPASDKSLEPMASKKPRATSSSRLPAPATPSKKGTTAMSRVSSSNSVAQTPREQASTTPSATGSVDRRTNGQAIARADGHELKTMQDKETRMSRLARDLKHKADLSMKDVRASPSADTRLSSAKRGYVLSLESIIAFMLGFQAQNLHRGMCNKRCDPTGWASMFPLMEFLQKEMRRQDAGTYRPLYALLLLLYVVSIDELIKCYGNLDNPGPHVSLLDLIRHERTRARLLPLIRETNDLIENTSLRANVAMLSTLDEISETALRILRRWCADESVDWQPEVNMKDVSAKSGSG